MNKDKRITQNAPVRPLVPRLRFPEFVGAGDWDVKAIDDIFTVTRGYVLAIPLLSQNKTIEMPYPVYSSQTKNNGLCGYYSNFLYENAITWTTDGANAGDVNYREGKFYCTNVCGVLLSNKDYANQCIAEQLNAITKQYVSYVGNPKLMNGVMAKIELPIATIAEQQRIADCLTSLDENITAQGHKLDTLKAHKKGLMQKLFPAEGERVPELRFKEFAEDGEWEVKALQDIAHFINKRTYIAQITKENYISTENIMPDYQGVKDSSSLPALDTVYHFKKHDILISNIRPYLKKVWLATKEGGASNDIIIIRAKEDVTSLFLSMTLKNDAFIEYVMDSARGVKMPRGDISLIQKYPLKYTGIAEQQRIADCLMSLDELITAQTRKMELLTEHKKGLMQQLFPNLERTAFRIEPMTEESKAMP